MKKCDHFVDNGSLGEKCRLYVSVNRRDDEKVRKALLHYLIDHPELDLSKIDRKIASIAGKVENKAENKWLFDIDTTDESTIIAFKHDLISAIGEDNLLQEYNTPNGRHIIVKHGFDSRELMTNWQHVVDLKRDEMQLFCFKEKN